MASASGRARRWARSPLWDTYNNKLFVIPEWQMVVVRLGLDQRDRKITDETMSAFIAKMGEAMRTP